MSDNLTVSITGKDGISRIFQEVTRGADKLADSLEKAGDTGSRGLDDLGKAAKQSANDMQSAGRDSEAFARSINTFQQETESAAQNLRNLADQFDYLSNAAIENERLTSGLAKAYGDAGDDMLAFADHIQDTTKFSNDAAQSALLLANSLSANYGLAADQVQNLLSVSADLAAMYGLELPDAMMRVSGAIRGEGEAAELLGLNMSDAAVAAKALEAGITNWSVPGALSEAEKGAFRYQLVMEQAAYATGTAAEAASGVSGTIARLGNEFQDMATGASQALGPLPAIGGALANVASESFTVVGGGAALVGMFRSAGMGAKNLATQLAGTAAGARILSAAMSPGALGLGALGVAVTAGYLIWQRHQQKVEDNKRAYEELQGAIKLTDDIVRNLNFEGKFELANEIRREIEEARGYMDEFALNMGEIDWFGNEASLGEFQNRFSDFIGKALAPEVVQHAVDNFDLPESVAEKILAGDEQAFRDHAVQLQQAAKDYYSKFAPDSEDLQAVETAMEPLFDLFANPNFDADKLNGIMDDLFQQWADGTITTDQFVAKLNELFTDITAGADTFNIMADGATTLNKDLGDLAATAAQVDDIVGDLTGTMLDLKFEGKDQIVSDLETLENVFGRINESSADTVDEFGRLLPQLQLSADGAAEAAYAFDGLSEAIASGKYDNEAIIAQLLKIANDPSLSPDQRTAEYFRLFQDVANTDKYLKDMTVSANLGAAAIAMLGDNVGNTADRLELFQSVGVGVFEAITGSAQTAADTIATIDEAVASGVSIVNAGLDAMFAGIDERAAKIRELLSLGSELAGVNNPLDQINLTGLSSQYTQLASDIGVATSALETGYRVVVQNTDAIGKNAQAVMDWADALIGAEGTAAKIDELLANGAINQQEYVDAQAAYNKIAEANLGIQENLLAIQAKQAPVLAELTEDQAAYIDSLADLPATQQAVALGWMDANSAAQANQAITLAAAAANGELGESGKAAAQAYIDGAIAANPYLAAMLEDIGLISGPDHEINFEVAEGAKSEIEMLTESVDALTLALGGVPPSKDIELNAVDNATPVVESTVNDLNGDSGLPPVVIPIEAEDNATAIVDDLKEPDLDPILVDVGVGDDEATPLIDDFNDTEIVIPVSFSYGPSQASPNDRPAAVESETVTITTELDDQATEGLEAVRSLAGEIDGTDVTLIALGDIDRAMDAFRDAEQAHRDLDGDRVTMFVQGDAGDAFAEFGSVDKAHDRLDGQRSTMYVEGDASDAFDAISDIRAYDGDVLARSYYVIETIYSSSGSGGGGGSFQRHGGMPGFAHGGMPGFAHGGMVFAEMGEAGVEMAHMANGGIVPILEHGIYGVPAGTYISPAPAAVASAGGNTYEFHFHAPVYGVDDLKDQIVDTVFPLLVEAADKHRRSAGVA